MSRPGERHLSNGEISAVVCTLLAVVVLAAGPAGVPGSLFLLACAAYRWQEARSHRPAVRVRERAHG